VGHIYYPLRGLRDHLFYGYRSYLILTASLEGSDPESSSRHAKASMRKGTIDHATAEYPPDPWRLGSLRSVGRDCVSSCLPRGWNWTRKSRISPLPASVVRMICYYEMTSSGRFARRLKKGGHGSNHGFEPILLSRTGALPQPPDQNPTLGFGRRKKHCAFIPRSTAVGYSRKAPWRHKCGDKQSLDKERKKDRLNLKEALVLAPLFLAPLSL